MRTLHKNWALKYTNKVQANQSIKAKLQASVDFAHDEMVSCPMCGGAGDFCEDSCTCCNGYGDIPMSVFNDKFN